ncbi:MAG TPA: BTAD domain-containing putative transcriptional regulator [Ktedonobacteraceae bacterium]
MHTPDLSRQIMPPALPSTVLHRAHLLSTLREVIVCETRRTTARSLKKLVLLCAPAGYGKTTLLADFAASAALPCCWYFLEHIDTDSVLFLRTLLASLCVTFPRLDQTLTTVFTNQIVRETSVPENAHRIAIDLLCNVVHSEVPERFALFLCNYEQINESEALTDLVNYLLTRMPPQMVLVIESRALPQIELARLIVRDEVFALNSNTLRFSTEEISDLARLHGLTTLTASDAEHLAASFDGWIAGILLGTRLGDLRFLPAGQAAQAHSDVSFLREHTAPAHQRKNLFAYVVHEVFQRTQALYRFLQPTCILQHMEAEICNALLQISDAAELLAQAERQGLFISSYESGSQTIYLCHPVIRDLLTGDLRQQNATRYLALHRRAAELWHARQDYDQAMYHALAARATDLAVQFLVEAFPRFLQQGRLGTLTNWLQALPSARKERSPRLLVIECTVVLARGQYLLALPVLERLDDLLADSAPEHPSAELERLRAEAHLLRSRALYQAGDYLQAQALCGQTLLTLPEQEIELRAEANMRIGICANLLGDFPAGILHLQEVLHNWHHQLPLYQVADIHGLLVNAYYLTGNFVLAEHHLARALHSCEQLQDEQGRVNNLTRRGVLSLEQGRYKEAETDLQEALALARSSVSAHSCQASVLANLGFLHLEQGLYARALTFYEDALILASALKSRQMIHSILTNMSLIHLFLGDFTSALVMLDKIEAQSEGMVSYEQAERELTYGLILLYQQRYDEASARLAAIEQVLRASGLQQELQIARLRLAACRLASGQEQAALDLLADLTLWLAERPHYLHLVLVQMQWLPALFQLVKSSPRLGHLRVALALESAPRETSRESRVAAPPARPAASSITIRAFGEPAVLLADRPIKGWRMARAMELFFFLLDAGSPESKERIITALWPEFDENVNQTFHSTLHQLRKLLGDACFVFHTNGYSLHLAAHYGENVWYDVQEFRRHRREADQALVDKDDATAKKALLAMVGLYQGDFARPFSHDWCIFRRDELCTIYLEAQRQLAQVAWRAQAYDESIYHWRHILEKDNCREEAHYHIMLCYLRQARRSAALRHYHICKEILREELGIDPGPAIENLYRRLKAKIGSLDA